MRWDEETKTLFLSRRNLLTLLAKLDGNPPNSFATIHKDGMFVTAEEDMDHYTDRIPGVMHRATEKAIDAFSSEEYDLPA